MSQILPHTGYACILTQYIHMILMNIWNQEKTRPHL